MIFGRLDWKHSFLGLAFLVGSVAVLGLTVVRVQNLQKTVNLPKATGITYSCTGTGSTEVGWCGGMGKSSGDYSCGCGGWTPSGPTGANCKSNFNNYICRYDAPDNKCYTSAKVTCSSKTDQSSCQAVSGCSWTASSSCANPYSPSYGQPQGQISGVTSAFAWTWCDPSLINWSTVYLWNCNPASCSSAFAAADGGSHTNGNLTLANFGLIGGGGAVTLQPNTQYWWSLNPNSCASYPSVNCPVGSGPGIASFTTGAAPVTTGTVQGCKVLGTSGDCYASANSVFNSTQVTLDGTAATALGNSAPNSYAFIGVSAGNHQVAVPAAPAGYTVSGYSLCTNQTGCHTSLTGTANSISVNVPANGYADLWWHFAAAATCQITSAAIPVDPFKVGDPDRVVSVAKTPDNAQVTCTSGNPGVVSIVSGCTYRAVSAGNATITIQLTLNGANCGSPTSQTVNVGASHLSCVESTTGAPVCALIAGTGTGNCSPVGAVCGTHNECVSNSCTVVANTATNYTNTCNPVGSSCGTQYYSCQSRTCALATVATANANGCDGGHIGGTCCSSNSDCSGGQTCGTSTTPNVCVCSSGQTWCTSACRNLQTDTANCGTCGHACATGQVCTSGTCASSCSGSTPDLCGTTCTNKQTDSNNCGTCGNVCSSGQTCVGGACTSGCNDTLRAPILTTPASGATGVSTQPALSWTAASGACTTGVTFTVYFGSVSTTLAPITSCQDTTSLGCTLVSGNLASNTIYYWKVTAKRETVTADSPVWSFTTGGGVDEVSSCWGNTGSSGRCYDCNGDGKVNILDFSCFAKHWNENL